MKSNPISKMLGLAALLAGVNAFAVNPAQFDALNKTLNAVSVTEMPATAAELVLGAKVNEQSDVAKTVVSIALARKSTIAPALIASISKGIPEVAVDSALTAAMQQPKQIGQITKAAVAAAPSQAAAIVAALCKQFPTKYNLIALAANEAAPQAGKQILAAVAVNVPYVQPVIERAVASTATPDVVSVIGETEKFVQSSAADLKSSPEKLLTSTGSTVGETAALAPPTLGGPFQPVSPSTPTINRDNTSVVAPGGGRAYGGP